MCASLARGIDLAEVTCEDLKKYDPFYPPANFNFNLNSNLFLASACVQGIEKEFLVTATSLTSASRARYGLLGMGSARLLAVYYPVLLFRRSSLTSTFVSLPMPTHGGR